AIAFDAGAHHGETDAVAGDRSAVGDPGAVVAARDLEPPQIVGPGRDGDHLADVGDDAGEHQARSKVSMVSSPTASIPRERRRGEPVSAASGRPSSASMPSGP